MYFDPMIYRAGAFRYNSAPFKNGFIKGDFINGCKLGFKWYG